jgi:30S ribosomal protein S31
MGKGDIKTKRGKIFKGTFGVSRPHKVTVVQLDSSKKKKAAPKKKAAK